MCAPLHEVHRLAHAHSQRLIDDRNATGYDVHGLFGIFGNADPIAGKRGRRYFTDYGGTKVHFMHEAACAMRDVQTVCEVGFCAGLSALLLLEALPSATVLSFDLGDLPWARAADALLRSQYGPARFPGVVFGDAATTIRAHHAAHPFACDAVFVDSAKTYTGRYRALVDLRAVSRAGAHVFMDEVTREDCVNGTHANDRDHKTACYRLNTGYWSAVRAYNLAALEGWLRVRRCAWPRRVPFDGICLGLFS